MFLYYDWTLLYVYWNILIKYSSNKNRNIYAMRGWALFESITSRWFSCTRVWLASIRSLYIKIQTRTHTSNIASHLINQNPSAWLASLTSKRLGLAHSTLLHILYAWRIVHTLGSLHIWWCTCLVELNAMMWWWPQLGLHMCFWYTRNTWIDLE